MTPLPLPIRVAAGLVATAVEQARDLPRQLAELPITAVSQTLQAGMRVQQKVTELAIKGDRALSVLQPVEEKPSWATFDDDLDVDSAESYGTDPSDAATEEFARNGAAPSRPRTVTPIDVARETTPPPAPEPVDRIDAVDDLDSLDDAEALALIEDAEDEEGGAAPATPPAGPPALAEYPQLSIPQLRGRLRFLTLNDLRSLLAWEQANGARPPYVTMLQNRITTVVEGG
ncbi:lipid droplet-associated protein [Pseudonocardia sp. CA-107938]|uniref:lipid droplet-associated protein n=1 Tax=Pseudonocardia sp. CA-107938 TaxID=3240021 RepID=UPI003D8D340A